MAEEPSARITLKEVYNQVQKIQSTLENLASQLPGISQKLDKLEAEVNKGFESRDVKLNDHEERIRKVEMNLWKLFGALGLVAAIIGPLVTFFSN